MKVFVGNELSGHLRGVLENLGINVEVKRVLRINGNSQKVICSVATDAKEEMEKVVKLLDDFCDEYSKAGFGENYDYLDQWIFDRPVEEVATALETFSCHHVGACYLSSVSATESCIEIILNEQASEDWLVGMEMLREHLNKAGIHQIIRRNQ